MIFSFEPPIFDWPADAHSHLESALTRLVMNDFNGNHLFVANRREIKWALENCTFPGFLRSHLHTIYQQFSLRGDLVEGSRVRAVIASGGIGIEANDDGSIFRIGLQSFLNSRFIDSRTKLVVENVLNDTQIHQIALNAARRAEKAPTLSFEPVHAGGSTIGVVFENLVQDGYIVAAISDSEKKCPASSVGSTARAMNSAFNRVKARGNYIAIASILPCHEMENVLPPEAVSSGLNHHHHGLISLVGHIAASGQLELADDAWAYLDLKNGFSGRDVRDKWQRGLISQATLDWFSRILSCSPDDIDSYDVPGLGENLSERFIAQPLAMKEFHRHSRGELWLQRFAPFYALLAWLMAAPERQRVGTTPLPM